MDNKEYFWAITIYRKGTNHVLARYWGHTTSNAPIKETLHKLLDDAEALCNRDGVQEARYIHVDQFNLV